ncbi:tRNA (N6-threonylcarbamoyladenosine(37)-N6)-methyltransferase TrmO [Enterococcus florum]|uniref:tRNA (N6-threonylcarbamoyladenosine(37)-N6)-methyltransferase TrmO n=1 Tax=Enterococcus florum TaxID=2480627 RepID=A0A4P5PH18_9ENTE|nr:SAM-dependent methyltransferase [Enterococcus florum]GCF95721.1 tRNA (N6-threonylcarbamoyladenosine(37)-N6)-methyltransferase TrmO [Enterococcus florum]
MKVTSIGTVRQEGDKAVITLIPEVKEGLKGLKDFSHVKVLYWFDQLDIPELRKQVIQEKPYVHGPEELGVFATRGPVRPNPIAVSIAEILAIDEVAGTIEVIYIDAESGSPVLDLKPYTPSSDIIETYHTPEWCRHWPQSYEASGAFDWSAEFNFPS